MEYEDIGSNIVSKYYEDPEPKQTANINIMSATGISQKIPLQEGYSKFIFSDYKDYNFFGSVNLIFAVVHCTR